MSDPKGLNMAEMIRFWKHNDEMGEFIKNLRWDGLLRNDYDTQRSKFDRDENPGDTEKERIRHAIETLRAAGTGVHVGEDGARILAETAKGGFETQLERIGGMRSEDLTMLNDTEMDIILSKSRDGFWTI
jgi:hypothetical protein